MNCRRQIRTLNVHRSTNRAPVGIIDDVDVTVGVCCEHNEMVWVAAVASPTPYGRLTPIRAYAFSFRDRDKISCLHCSSGFVTLISYMERSVAAEVVTTLHSLNSLLLLIKCQTAIP